MLLGTEYIAESFARLYGGSPHWIARAPGRVNLIGEHTDYNGGFVLPMAIDRHTQIAAAPNSNNVIRMRSTSFDDVLRIDLADAIQPMPRGAWSNYPRGVIAGFRDAGLVVPGLDLLIHSDVPLGSGLSSSAALEVALATVLEAAVGTCLDPKRKATLCREAEHRYAGVPCGIMDQLVCAAGTRDHLLLIDCRSEETEHVDFSDPSVSILIVDTQVRHRHSSGNYAARRAECEIAAKRMGVSLLREAKHELLEEFRDDPDDRLYRRALHVLSEDIRAYRTASLIRDRDWLRAGLLMYRSHESLRDNFEVSCAELDAVVDIARGIGTGGGIYGCRMTGGGFGGCAVALIRTEAQASISDRIASEYWKATGTEPTMLISRPAQGATLVRQPS